MDTYKKFFRYFFSWKPLSGELFLLNEEDLFKPSKVACFRALIFFHFPDSGLSVLNVLHFIILIVLQ